MNTQNKFEIERDTRLKYQFLRFKMGIYNVIHKKWVWLLVLAYIAVAIFARYLLYSITPAQSDISAVINTIALKLTYPFFAVAGFIVLLVFLGTPQGASVINENLWRIGLVNHAGQYPILLRKFKEHGMTVMEFEPNGIPVWEWEDNKERIETALNVHIVKIEQGISKRRILLYAISGNESLPKIIYWKDNYLSYEDFTLIPGQSITGQVKINLAKIPHILLGGSTGSGKSVLLKLLIMQCVKKDADVFIADFKGGVDFLPVWHERCNIITDENTLCVFSIVGYSIWFVSVKNGELSKLFIIKFLEPMFACVFSAAILGEDIFKLQYLAAFVLISLGIFISENKTC